ncbi:hypothetical protein I5M27_15135 [Adhaeribacter sp. BT258]|uniref:Uncharacterized protein n=1 Tax=Adhaeribacter terrigena TaxID=2793070 RepID=A0ABS1C6W2_9BACT|nr:hypothetical protein [Adhaeribacter terrigena]MBK0404330.1 hypothetical protein [Adhaeribacter terrigena]
MKKKILVSFILVFGILGGIYYLVKFTDFLQDRKLVSAKHKEAIRPLSEIEILGKEFCKCMVNNGSPAHYEYAWKVCEGELIQKYEIAKLMFVDFRTPHLRSRLPRKEFYKVLQSTELFEAYLNKKCKVQTVGRDEKTLNSCNCEPGLDPDDYLFKICKYIKKYKISVFPASPCGYQITNIKEVDHLVYVYLDCCYLGEVATFDKETGEIINFSLGAK